MSALKCGDEEMCLKMREESKNDHLMLAKFQTLERIWIGEMTNYVRELQILKRERDAYERLAKGYKLQLKNQGDMHLEKGFMMLKQAEEARMDHDEVSILNVFAKV